MSKFKKIITIKFVFENVKITNFENYENNNDCFWNLKNRKKKW